MFAFLYTFLFFGPLPSVVLFSILQVYSLFLLEFMMLFFFDSFWEKNNGQLLSFWENIMAKNCSISKNLSIFLLVNRGKKIQATDPFVNFRLKGEAGCCNDISFSKVFKSSSIIYYTIFFFYKMHPRNFHLFFERHGKNFFLII